MLDTSKATHQSVPKTKIVTFTTFLSELDEDADLVPSLENLRTHYLAKHRHLSMGVSLAQHSGHGSCSHWEIVQTNFANTARGRLITHKTVTVQKDKSIVSQDLEIIR